MSTIALATPGTASLTPEEVKTLQAMDFDWTMNLQEVWNDPAYDSTELNADLRLEFAERLLALRQQQSTKSPLGWVVIGSGGSGKTHWLSICRRETVKQQIGFVLVDMTDVHSFWDTVLQGYLDSLQQVYDQGKFQQQVLLEKFLGTLQLKMPVATAINGLRNNKPEKLATNIEYVVGVVAQRHPAESLKHSDVIRALLATNSRVPEIAAAGLSWLHGNPVDAQAKTILGFAKACDQPKEIVKALSWLMSLCAPTVLALDQLDPIVSYLNLASDTGHGEATAEAMAAKAIIEGISKGMGAIRDVTTRTLTVVASLEATWSTLKQQTLNTNFDRYESARKLFHVQTGDVARSVVVPRVATAAKLIGFTLPYATWPFSSEMIDSVQGKSPRQLLKDCDRYRRQCLAAKCLVPWQGKFEDDKVVVDAKSMSAIDQQFAKYRDEADPAWLLEERQEDERLCPLLVAACRAVTRELPLPAHLGAQVDQFPGGKTTKPLHARIRLIDHEQNELEEHFCLRTLERTNANAFQHRLKGAITASGIDKQLGFRRVVILRSRNLPSGQITSQLVNQYKQRGGLWHKPSEHELRTLYALEMLVKANPEGFEEWLKARRPASSLPLMQLLMPKWTGTGAKKPSDHADCGDGEAPGVAVSSNNKQPKPDSAAAKIPPKSRARKDVPPDGNPTMASPDASSTATEDQKKQTEPAKKPAAKPQANSKQLRDADASSSDLPPTKIRIGYRQVGLEEKPVDVALPLLEKHTIVLAGAGSGKTVLLKHLVEQATLAGIPSILIDGANDLASIGDHRTVVPSEWRPGDAERADEFHRKADVIVWTPGLESANPLAFEPLPDLNAVADDADELNAAVDISRAALVGIVAQGKSAAAQSKVGILVKALHFLAQQASCTLDGLIEVLSNLPDEAGTGIAKQAKLAAEMADALRSRLAVDTLLRSRGKALDPAILFGDDQPYRERTRISVINFVGLAGLESQQQFLNQLAMTLFGWIKRHPKPEGRPLRGLLVIDEAKDFVPSQKSTPCKESLERLAAQARKYHLGLIFATQNPKEIENRVIGNCSSAFFGKSSSPEGQKVIREQIQNRGGDATDIAALARGTFYFSNADTEFVKPTRVKTPLCLSNHGPLDPTEVKRRAQASRDELE